MKATKVKSVADSLYQYDYFTQKGSTDDYIEVTEWQSGEGFYISVGAQTFSLSRGEVDAIYHLVNELDFNGLKATQEDSDS